MQHKDTYTTTFLLKYIYTHTHTQPFNGVLSGTTRVSRYQKKYSPTDTTHKEVEEEGFAQTTIYVSSQ